MPLLNGFELIEIVRANPQTKTLPIVVCTSSFIEADILKAKALGANHFVTKTADFRALIEKVRPFVCQVPAEICTTRVWPGRCRDSQPPARRVAR
jgi:CheY-like chemotaxis protein